MLSISKSKSLYPKLIRSGYNFRYTDFTATRKDDHVFGFFKLCRTFCAVNNKVSHRKCHNLREFKREFNAVSDLLQRSNLPCFKEIIKQSQRNFQTSSTKNQNKDDKDKKNKDKDGKEDVPSLLPKAMFWMVATLTLFFLSSLFMPSNNSDGDVMRYVSWNDFYYNMLSKGEVEELIIRPDLEIVTIILHEGAVVKGKKVAHRVYHMNVGDIHRFEEKLREAERTLGVKEADAAMKRNSFS